MASTDARPVAQKNTAYRVYFPIFDNTGALVTGAAGLDSEVSKDGAAFADCTNEATEIGSSGTYYLDLTNTEMNADAVVVIVKTSTTDAKTTPIFLYPEESGDIRVNVTQIESADPSDTIRDAVVDDATRIDASALNTASGHIPTILDDTHEELPMTLSTIASVVDAILTDTGTTLQAELDGIEADIAGLNNISASDVWAAGTRTLTAIDEDSTTLDLDATIRSAVGMASANLDTQIDALPTNAELATALGTSDDATLAAIAALSIPSAATIADAVWDEDATAHQTQGTFGQAIGDPVADTNSIFKAVVTDATGATVGVDAAAILDDTGTSGVVLANDAITAAKIAADAIDASALASDAVTEIQSGLATAANLATVAGYIDTEVASILAAVDTEVAAIKAKTDQLTFTVANQVDSNALSGGGGLDAAGVRAAVGLASANLDTQLTAIDDYLDTEVAAIKAKTDSLSFTVAGQVDANIQYVNDTAVTGTGESGDEWGPA